MRKSMPRNGYLFLMIDGETVLSAHYDLERQGRALISTNMNTSFDVDLVAALVIAAIIEQTPPGVHVKLLTCIKLLEEKAKSASDDDMPF